LSKGGRQLSNDKSDTRTRILETAAEIIGKERNLNLTIREVAARADVNIASINYHFRSKENLLSEVEMLLMENIGHIYTHLGDPEANTATRLINWANNLIKHLIDYPGIIYLIGTRIIEKEQTGINQYLSLMDRDLAPLVKELAGIDDDNIVAFKVLQLISGVVYPILITSSSDEAAGINISDEKTRLAYVSLLVASIRAV
jgi:TetR/AcrR family transcriptional regulator, regulator of cefoperazone and chloramphenicol sensitivity